MSSYISIGFVSNDIEKVFIKKCKQLIATNSKNICKIEFKYPKYGTCDIWNVSNESLKKIDEVLTICFKNELAEMTVDYNINGKLIKSVLIRIEKEIGRYTGILFKVPEEYLNLENNIDELENIIMIYMQNLINIGFEYIFCDNEIDIEYSTKDILERKEEYSMLIIKNNDKLITKLALWKIDGLTSR